MFLFDKKNSCLSLFFCAILLIIVPIIYWIFNYHWSLNNHYNGFDLFLYLITETGTAPIYGLITSLIFAIFLSLTCKRSGWIMIFLTVFLIQFSTQVIKSSLKSIASEPRPFIAQLLVNEETISEFYSEKRKIRSKIIEKTINESAFNQTIPSFLKNHWQHETGYSFPSGHSAFAASWLLLFVGFYAREKASILRTITLSIIAIWAGLMFISRIQLGMHYPIDVFTSIIISFVVSLIIFKLITTPIFIKFIRFWHKLPILNRFTYKE